MSTERVRFTTIASSPAPPTRLPVRRWKTCSCGAALSPLDASANRCPALPYSPSPESPFADNLFEEFSTALHRLMKVQVGVGCDYIASIFSAVKWSGLAITSEVIQL